MRMQIPRLKAQKILDLLNVSVYPYTKPESEKEMITNYQRIADPHHKEDDSWWRNPPKGLQLVSSK
jgi:hypothetical protein